MLSSSMSGNKDAWVGERTRIKVCGITDQDEANEIVKVGVDALGFIFAEQSPRRIEPEKAREIIRQLPPFVDAVGVFVDEEAEVVNEIIQYCRLTMVQLHGEENPGYCESFPCPAIKAFRIGAASMTSEHSPFELFYDKVSGFLVDTFHEKMAGGTGQPFDWKLLDQMRPAGPLILAGGLSPDNVGQAILQVWPYAVDVNSGVEIEPGRKDIDLVKKVIQEVNKADAAKESEQVD